MNRRSFIFYSALIADKIHNIYNSKISNRRNNNNNVNDTNSSNKTLLSEFHTG